MEVSPDDPKGIGLREYATFLHTELVRSATWLSSPRAAEAAAVIVEEYLIALAQRGGTTTVEDESRACAGRGYVSIAGDYMRAHFEEPIAIADLARSIGVNLRSLQMAFRKHRGCSPRETLNRMRLEEVKRRLLDDRQAVSVSTAAFDCGFTHLGRFSTLYRETFGELPSETLRSSGK